jgi:hypothetical protein
MVTHCVFAGHFQRLFECFLRAPSDVHCWLSKEDFHTIIDFAIDNVDCLAYQQLLSAIVQFSPIIHLTYHESGVTVYFRQID